jgi:carbamoyltransferase
MNILGINAYHGDSAACLVRDGVLVAAVEEERFKRIKHWAGLPVESIRFCLQEAGLTLEDVDYIAVNRDPKANLFKKALFALRRRPDLRFLTDRSSNMIKIYDLKAEICRLLDKQPDRIDAKLQFVEHHRAHLASSFFVSPFKEAALLSVDGFGDFVSTMIGTGRGNRIAVIDQVNYPHSLGLFYSAVTQYLGFTNYGDEFKVMGLAALGRPNQVEKLAELVKLEKNGLFRLNLKFFRHHHPGGVEMTWNNSSPAIGQVYSDELVKQWGPARKYEEPLTQQHMDLAASLQALYEKAFFNLLDRLYAETGMANLCVAGGCALNSVANGKIFDRTGFKDVYIQSAAGDAGGAIGAAYYVQDQVLDNPRGYVMTNSYWGPSYNNEQIGRVLAEYEDKLKACRVERASGEDDLVKRTVDVLTAGKVIGWFQGKMEWGPRALGNRSIICDPRRAEMKDILNARIKRREAFRPFAPSILLEKTGEYFERDYPDPFMLKVYPIREEKRKLIPAVTHVDGTGRLQTVSREENPLYWKLIKGFETVTGIPVLLNTSFNENEPVVCRPEEALDCFLRTKMDVLVLGHYLIVKQAEASA